MKRAPNMGLVGVRLACEEDASSVARIFNHYVDEGTGTFDDQHWSDDQTATRIASPAPDGWFVATEGWEIWGWASVRRYSLRFGYRFTCESAIYLDPAALGSGVADRLQHRVDRHCLGRRIHHVVARIIADNSRSIAFHRRHGYELVGVQKEIGHIHDRWVDVAVMQKIFEDWQHDTT